jgi:hypothetical protein
MKRLSIASVGILLWVAFVALACNLGASGEPPTLVPRATATPLPTIGYATLSPDELPQIAATVAPQSEAAVLNLINQVEGDRLLTHVATLQSYGTRHINSPYGQPGYGIGAAKDYIVGEFTKIRERSPGFAIIEHNFSVSWNDVNSTASNIVGVLPGREVGAGVVILGAHYDSVSTDPNNATIPAPGANDNASGVAALIEIARVMSARPQPRATVMFVAFSAEEIGRVGSKAFINDYIRPYQIQPTAMINMDIIGSSTGPDGSVNDRMIRVFAQGAPEAPSHQLARALNLIAYNHMPSMQLLVDGGEYGDRQGRYSDHLSFSEAGYAAVRLIEPLEDVTRQHNDRDTTDDIQGAYLTKATQTVLALAVALSDGPRPPRSRSLRDSGGGVRTLVWEQVPDATSYVIALRRPGSTIYDSFFETTTNSVTWDGFVPTSFAGVAIAAKDASGLMGPLSEEYIIVN